MKKRWVRVVGIVLVLIVVVLVLIASNLGAVIKTTVEKLGPKFTGTEVELASAKVRLGKASLKGMRIGNPEGYKTPSAFELGEVAVDLDMGSLKSDTIVINRILIDSPEITFEKSLKKSNLAAILDNVNAAAGSGEGEPPEEEPEAAETDDAAGKSVVIEQFVLQGAKVKLSTALLMGKSVVLPLPKIEINDIGKKGEPASLPEASAKIMNAVIGAVFKVIAGSADVVGDQVAALGGAALKGVGATADMALKSAGAATDMAVKSVSAAGDTAMKTVGAAGDAAGAAAGAAIDGAGAVVGSAGDAAGAAAGAAADAAGATVDATGKALKGAGDAAGAAAGAATEGVKKLGGGVKKLGSGLGGLIKRDTEEASQDK